MSWVTAKPGETIESLLRRFKKSVENAGILADLKKHEYYEKPSVKRKRKQAAARKRAAKRAKKLERQSMRKVKNTNFKWNKDRTKKIPMPPPRNRSADKNTNSNSRKKPTNNTNRSRPNTKENQNKGFSKRPRYIKKDKS